jgi:mRNA interferase MazF
MPSADPVHGDPSGPLEAFTVVRVPFPFSDRLAQRRRPAVVLSPAAFQQSSGHLLLAMITTARQSSWPLDWPIEDLQATGLNQPCLIRLKLFSLDERLILGRQGELAHVDRLGLQANLRRLIVLD